MGKARGSGKGGVRARVTREVVAYEDAALEAGRQARARWDAIMAIRDDAERNRQLEALVAEGTGPWGVEKAIVTDAQGRVVWTGTGTRTEVAVPTGVVPEGGMLSHYHPDNDRAFLSRGDVQMALLSGAGIRAYTQNGTYQEFIPNGKHPNGVGVGDLDIENEWSRRIKALPERSWIREYTRILQEYTAGKGTWRDGRRRRG